MTGLEKYLAEGQKAGCPAGQMGNFVRAGVVLQPRQLAASAAARLCDRVDGPTAVGYGGARGGGKSHWLLAQVGADCRIAKSYGRGYMLTSDSEYAVRPSFSVAQWEAIQTAVAIADRYQPGIAARARLPI